MSPRTRGPVSRNHPIAVGVPDKWTPASAGVTFPTKPRAMVLVAVLWIIALLTVMVTVTAKTARLDTRVGLAWANQTRARWAVKAGVERAIALLEDDSTVTDTLNDLWWDNDIDCNDVQLSGCKFSIRLVDEARKLNVNTATRKQLLQLPHITKAIADSIIDWRDKDQTPSSQGAEAGYYRNLIPGYEIRNGPFKTLRELLLVKDITHELLFGEDTNLNRQLDYNENDGDENWPSDNQDGQLNRGWFEIVTCYSYEENKDRRGNQRVNINKADEQTLVRDLELKSSQAKWIVENRKDKYKSIADLINKNSPSEPSEEESDQAQPLDRQTFARIVDKITLLDDNNIPGKVNLNTADKVVLQALLEGNSPKAQAVIDHRSALFNGFDTIAELLKVKSIRMEDFKKMADHVTTRSNVFTVNTVVTSSKTSSSYRAEAVVDRNATTPEILYWYEGVGY